MLPWLQRHWPLALVVVLLLLWSLASQALADALFLPTWVVATQLIVAGSLEAARLQRRAWLDQYLYDDSPWHRWLRGGVMMVLRHELVGALLVLVLLVKLRLLPFVVWPLLLVGAVGLVLARRWLRRRLARHVIDERLPAVTRRLLVPPVAGLLALVLVAAAFWLPQPWLVGLGWEEAIAQHLSGGEGDSLLAFFERLAGSAEITQYWAMQNAVERLGLDAPVALLGWLLLLLTQGAVAWAYVRLLVGVDALRKERPAVTRHRQQESREQSP
ncbi:hypothetical protein [Halomonas cerina]|uniref:Uncharacterized protein n=1 Tax=Halomonas cerina TaxID=447424 RepID=A0A839V2B4_9GAMM|nr:hypothetical protein [Halomonas cerina]MBB3189311.1 hypothetical protein [Halomonas cerina]